MEDLGRGSQLRGDDSYLPLDTPLSNADTQRFDVQLVFEAVEDFIADRAVVPQADQGQAFGRQRLVAQPPERQANLGRTFLVPSSIGRKPLHAASIVHAQPV